MVKQISEQNARRLFDEHSTYVFKTAYLLCKSKTLADDILQKTFIQVFRKYHMYDASKPFKPWLYRITVNIAKNMIRKQKWLLDVDESQERLDPNERTPIEQLLQDEMTVVIKNELDKLSLKSREVIILHFYTGLTLTEVAESLGIPIGTCKSRLHTALNQLRKQLNDNDFFEFEARGGLT
ncbi:RNA polymerase sigma factor [Alicyclobacillus sp. ALC3]|uniref:RNA polymerase sigma factor n=1 Tax=Alicyclobacillus sp. ALC3 TaxID=2796143 RepID=UPI0023791138|nr:RNA polymerase sigma factor [Alicyclobacillus sp. ALC3]WDL98880.1 RNA polymerase sigma factor [Alicyclobacillus sp. ALC3]